MRENRNVLEIREAGLFCPAGDFYIDPVLPVARALLTHAHSDHARPGSDAYLAAEPGAALLRHRLGPEIALETLPYGDRLPIQGVTVSFHPAGHMLGSAQIRIERGGEVWVCSGDYKLDPDPTCAPFEPVPCHAFITESTFALPIFRWPSPADVFSELHAWWRANQESGRASVVFAYPLGKAQRVLAGLDPATGPIVCHPSIDAANAIYRAQGVALPPTVADTKERARALVLAPPLTAGSTWLRRFPRVSLSMASGWMRIRGPRRRRALDRGFVLSDHADWPSLQTAIAATRAERVWVTHGYRESLARWLNENGTPAQAIELPTPPEPEA